MWKKWVKYGKWVWWLQIDPVYYGHPVRQHLASLFFIEFFKLNKRKMLKTVMQDNLEGKSRTLQFRVDAVSGEPWMLDKANRWRYAPGRQNWLKSLGLVPFGLWGGGYSSDCSRDEGAVFLFLGGISEGRVSNERKWLTVTALYMNGFPF